MKKKKKKKEVMNNSTISNIITNDIPKIKYSLRMEEEISEGTVMASAQCGLARSQVSEELEPQPDVQCQVKLGHKTEV